MSKYLIFITVSITMLITTMSGTVVAVAFPNIITSFNTSLIVAGWVLGVNQLASTASMPLIGKIGDLYGNKKTCSSLSWHFYVRFITLRIGSEH